MLRIQTILHPTDFSVCSDYASNLACALTRDYGARLVVLHVAAPPVMAYGQGVIPPDPETTLKELQAQLDHLQLSTARVDRRLEVGTPAEEIVHTAKTTNADLIVMATHGRSGLSRLVMGSVADKVLRNAPCPVLLVKSPLD